jgi:hypothetical protein
MFWFTSVQVLSVVNIAPGSGGSASALSARNNPAAITAVNVSNLRVGFILILGFTFNFLSCLRCLLQTAP